MTCKLMAAIAVVTVGLVSTQPVYASSRHHHHRHHDLERVVHSVKHHHRHHRYAYHRKRSLRASASVSESGSSNSIVATARQYIGTNPTGRRKLWCGAFMDLVLRKTGHKPGGNLAKGYLHYGRRISGPVVGAIAVMGRRGGGHVGVVSAIDANGNPVVISGNHRHTTAESTYPRERIIAYIDPNS